MTAIRTIMYRYTPRLIGATTLLLAAATANARQVVPVPEPSILSILGFGVVVAIIIKRINDDK